MNSVTSVELGGGAATVPNHFVDVGGRTLAYRGIGEGLPIVLCTRFRGNLDTWDPVFVDALADNDFRVFLPTKSLAY